MALTHLLILAKRLPDVAAALAELSHLEAVLTLPTPTVHVVSDVHGEHVKLRQVINNASGSLRPLFERLFAGSPGDEIEQLLTLVYYPHESWEAMTRGADEPRRRELLHWAIGHGTVAIRALARRYTIKYVERIVPDPFDPVFRELMFADELARQPAFVARLLEPFVRHGRAGELVRAMAHVIRNLAVGELIVAGDLGDRGPRIDKVIDLLIEQPRIAITWGNHDADWMAACLGHGPAITTVIRLSLRYQRLAQLEDGYGISLEPVRRLAREAYADDPAACFELKGELGADAQQLARMQKAIAILQFKLEGQMFERRPEWGLAHRALLRKLVIDPAAGTGTVELDGVRYPLRDARFPTVDWAEPLRLSPAEQRCLDELSQAFVASRPLWQQMSFVAAYGTMSLRRDLCAIFHGCVPVDDAGEPLAFTIDGEPRKGKALFDAFEAVVQRAFRGGASGADDQDKDLIFYLWTGPSSPCFGKDRMATFETYLVEDEQTHHEAKNPYFKLLGDPAFCARILAEFGVDPTAGFIINGHVPVKLEAGETPIKKSGRAITIDGAFAAAYGDKGFSLVLDPERIYLAQHHHFESAAAAVNQHADIVPTVSDVVVHARPRTVGDTEIGEQIRAELAVIGELVGAFEAN
ncbi:MAG TPA: fructose-bisphosphatase class III, partial [Kofleriaceae bacterium]